MRVKGVAADGLLSPEEVQVSGPVLILRLLEESGDTRKGGRVVVAGKLSNSSPVQGRLLHRNDNCRSRCIGRRRLCEISWE